MSLFKEQLTIIGNFEKVIYDGREYPINKIEEVTTTVVYHYCGDLFYQNYIEHPMVLELDWVGKINNKKYRLAFCNKCKTLYVTKIRR